MGTRFKLILKMMKTEARETTREEIENKLKTIGGDMLKIEYLENVLKQNQTFDIKKFANVKLAELYEKRLMLKEAAKNLDAAAEIAVTFREKIDLYKKQIEVCVNHGSLDAAEEAFRKAIVASNEPEKRELRDYLKSVYFKRAEELERMQKNSNAIKIYEKLLPLGFVSEEEKRKINSKLAVLYRRVGKILESMRLGG